ncbi:hypothetical protein ABZ671_01255 [Micromonospora sp. NPDC006766]
MAQDIERLRKEYEEAQKLAEAIGGPQAAKDVEAARQALADAAKGKKR